MTMMRRVRKNAFVKANVMGAGSSLTENGAMSYATTGDALVDQFGKAGTARGRLYSTVWAEQAALWAQDSESALRFPFYLRMITRKDYIKNGDKTENVQKGQGARDEAFKRLLWIAAFHPEEFYRNLWLLPVIGSWKDLWTLLFMASNDELPVTDFTLDTKKFFDVIVEGLKDSYHCELVMKYLPRIRSNQKCTTQWAITTNRLAKEFCEYVGWSYKDYRTLKATGHAHEFQRIICKGLYENINWKAIPGKALLNLVSGKFLENHELTDSYIKWLYAQPTVKFNGYAFELLNKYKDSKSLANKVTIDKQFDNLIESAKDGAGMITGNVLCALDTSASMSAQIEGAPKGVSSFDVCVSLGIFFSELNEGAFHNTVAMFDNESRLLQLSGTFTEKVDQINKQETAWGSTNFQSVIELICRTRIEHPEIPLEEFPKTLLVVSDMQFNDPCWFSRYKCSNVDEAKATLLEVFPKEFVDEFTFIWWHCEGRQTDDMPSTVDDANSYFFSGFDPSIVTMLLGGEMKVNEQGETVKPSMEELVEQALGQEALALVC